MKSLRIDQGREYHRDRHEGHPRFAAFANGASIHADDFDDTLSAAKDRVYGLLTHPTVGVLPPASLRCANWGIAAGKTC